MTTNNDTYYIEGIVGPLSNLTITQNGTEDQSSIREIKLESPDIPDLDGVPDIPDLDGVPDIPDFDGVPDSPDFDGVPDLDDLVPRYSQMGTIGLIPHYPTINESSSYLRVGTIIRDNSSNRVLISPVQPYNPNFDGEYHGSVGDDFDCTGYEDDGEYHGSVGDALPDGEPENLMDDSELRDAISASLSMQSSEISNCVSNTVNYDDGNLNFQNIPTYAWHSGTKGSFRSDNDDTTTRRGKRVPLTELYNPKTIYKFVIEMLQKAWESELLDCDDDVPYSFYVFDPYYPKSYNCSGIDEFSKKSMEKKIGIRTKLNIYNANFILSCYYLLYSNFELTSEELIFESSYRSGVLMSDSSFELAKFMYKLAIDYPQCLAGVESLVSSSLDLNISPDIDSQYSVWMLTFSKQTKKLVTPNSSEGLDDFLTIEDLCNRYSRDWLENLLNPPVEKSLIDSITSNLSSAVSTIASIMTSDPVNKENEVYSIECETKNPIHDEITDTDLPFRPEANFSIEDRLEELMSISSFSITKGGMKDEIVETSAHSKFSVNPENEELLSAPSSPKTKINKDSSMFSGILSYLVKKTSVSKKNL